MPRIRESNPNATPAAPIEASARSKRRAEVAIAQDRLDTFIALLARLPMSDHGYILSMDAYAAFERFAAMDLPSGFNLEFGRRINRACQVGKLSFRRVLKEKPRLAAFHGVEQRALMKALLE